MSTIRMLGQAIEEILLGKACLKSMVRIRTLGHRNTTMELEEWVASVAQ